MSDFDDNWQLTGSSDPATPDIQPHQMAAQAQPQTQSFNPTPVQPFQPQVQQPVPAQPINNIQPQPLTDTQAQIPYQQPVFQNANVNMQQGTPPVQPGSQQPVQPVYQPPVYGQSAPQPYGYPSQQPAYLQSMPQGAGYQAQQVPYQNIDYAVERENNLNECTRMINHFSQKVDLYQDYEKCKTDIVRYSRTSIAPLVWGIIVSLLGLTFVFSAVTANYKDNIIGYAVTAGVFLLFGGGLVFLYVMKKIKGKKKTEALYAQLSELSDQLFIVYNGFSNCVLPSEFTDPRILFKIQSLISSGRCISINNALNSLLSVQNTYMRLNAAKNQFQKDTAERFNGKPAFFNAVRYLDLR